MTSSRTPFSAKDMEIRQAENRGLEGTYFFATTHDTVPLNQGHLNKKSNKGRIITLSGLLSCTIFLFFSFIIGPILLKLFHLFLLCRMTKQYWTILIIDLANFFSQTQELSLEHQQDFCFFSTLIMITSAHPFSFNLYRAFLIKIIFCLSLSAGRQNHFW